MTCSHTFAALSIILGGCKGLHQEFTGDDGNVDQLKVLKLCPSWKKPMQEGIPCTVFRRELEEACPELPAFLSKAGNQSHDVHSKETKLQFMLALHQMFVAQERFRASAAESAPSAESTSPWDSVVQEMIVMKPHFADFATEAATFTSAWSGGEGAPALNEAETFAKSLKVRREPEYGQLGLLAKANLARAPRWPIMCLKTLMSAPACFCHNGEARMFTFADISEMETKLMSQIREATTIVETARKWFHMDMDKQPDMASRIFGDMEVRLVMHVHRRFAKKARTRTQFASLTAIGQQLAFDVQHAGGDMRRSPWIPHNSHAAVASAQPATKEAGILKVDADGSINIGERSAMFGIDVGSTIRFKDLTGDRTVYHIGKMEDRAVTLIAADDSTKTVSPGELADLYMPCKVAEDIVLRNPEFVKIEANSELIHDCVKAHAKMLLFHAFRLHQPHVNVDMKTTASKVKHIFAGEKYQTGQLKLVPYSPSIFNAAVEGKEKTPNSQFIQIKIRLTKDFTVTFGPSPIGTSYTQAKKQLVVPYWLLGATGDKDRANMQPATLNLSLIHI